MNANATPPWRRFSDALAALIVRAWPAETRDWAHAFAAELPEIECPLEALRWMLGGVMLLGRERLKYFLHSFGRPVGVPADSNLELLSKQSARIPRTPRFITFILLFSTLAILLHPEVRTCLRTIIRSYINPDENTSRWGSVRQLQKEVAISHDPKLFALLSLVSTDEVEASRLASEAIARDSSLTWLDFERGYLDTDPSHPKSVHKVERLQAWDPNNAAVWLISSEFIFESGVSKSLNSGLPVGTVKDVPDSKYRAEWAAIMSRAYGAGKYDNYNTRITQLIRDISVTHPRLDPDITAYIIRNERIPNLWNIRSYGQWLLLQGQEAEQRGDTSTASKKYWEVLRFSGMMRQNNLSSLEWFIGVSLGKDAAVKLQPLLEKTQQSQEAQILALQITEWDLNAGSAWRNRWIAMEWSGLTIQLVSVFILILAIVTFLSFILLLVPRSTTNAKRGSSFVFASWALDGSPLLLLLCSAALFFLYHPFAQTYNRFLFNPAVGPSRPELHEALFVTHLSLIRFFDSNQLTFHFWIAVTFALLLLFFLVLTRMAMRRRSSRDLLTPTS